jgi:hypothetical protein
VFAQRDVDLGLVVDDGPPGAELRAHDAVEGAERLERHDRRIARYRQTFCPNGLHG